MRTVGSRCLLLLRAGAALLGLALAGCATFEIKVETAVVLPATSPASSTPPAAGTPATAITERATAAEAASAAPTPTRPLAPSETAPGATATQAPPTLTPSPTLRPQASLTQASRPATAARTVTPANTAASHTPAATDCGLWYFDDSPGVCPTGPAEHFQGAAQWFERGFMLWTADPDKFYIFLYDNQTYIILGAPYILQSGQGLEATPPPGRYEPASGFGKVWRGEIATGNVNFENLAGRLGWALGPEQAYATDFQCQVAAYYNDQRCFLNDPGGALIRIAVGGAWGYWR